MKLMLDTARVTLKIQPKEELRKRSPLDLKLYNIYIHSFIKNIVWSYISYHMCCNILHTMVVLIMSYVGSLA